MNWLVKFVLAFLFLPLLISADVFRSERTLMRKIGYLLLIWIVLGSVWTRGYLNIINAAQFTFYELGVTDKLTRVKIVGTSMLPGIQDGQTVSLQSPKKYGLARGDIVSFQNIETGTQHYIKRVIGLEGEEIVIINGVVRINGQGLQEDYVFRREPTYGNTFLVECEPQTIPKGKVAVFGDNRIVSSDSRVLGFIDTKDIGGVIKTKITPKMQPPPSSLEQPKEARIDPNVFLEKLNALREKNYSRPLQIVPLLNQIATERSDTISSDFKSWKQQLTPIAKLLDRAGYQYLLVQEMVTFGYLNEQQIVDQITESVIYKDAFLSDRYYEIGIGTAVAQKGQCQFPIITVIISWPSNPGYSQEAIDVWNQDIDTLSRTIITLGELKSKPGINQQQTQELIDELRHLLETATQLSSRIEKNEWLTQEEYQLMDQYLEKTKTIYEKLASYYEAHQQGITDPQAKELLLKLVPGNTEFIKKSEETKLLFGQGKYDKQLKSAQKLLEMAENDKEKAIAHYWVGLAQYKLGQTSEAKSNLTTATQLDTEYAGPYVTLSAISFDEHNYHQGLEYASRCAEIEPEYAWCHNNLGLAHLFLGETEKGIAELEKAVSLDPTSYVFNDNLNRARK